MRWGRVCKGVLPEADEDRGLVDRQNERDVRRDSGVGCRANNCRPEIPFCQQIEKTGSRETTPLKLWR